MKLLPPLNFDSASPSLPPLREPLSVSNNNSLLSEEELPLLLLLLLVKFARLDTMASIFVATTFLLRPTPALSAK